MQRVPVRGGPLRLAPHVQRVDDSTNAGAFDIGARCIASVNRDVAPDTHARMNEDAHR